MWTYPEEYEVIVVGGGHAGAEAAHASARMGAKTLLLTMNLDTIGKMSCNPAVGGIGKGNIVREIDALGGIMGKLIDRTGIQFRMLNRTNGPAVWAPRAQADKQLYAAAAKWELENTPNLEIKQGTIEKLIVEQGKIRGVVIKEGIQYRTKTLVLSSGTFMRGLLHIGDTNYAGGRAGDQPSVGLSGELEKLGIKLGRLKTGTPPRIHARSINFSEAEEQQGEEGVVFSFDPPEKDRVRPKQISCHIAYTTEETKDVINANLHRSPLYSGKIHSIGPRYCPSIEDKVVRFNDKERHQIFLEPEGLYTNEYYINGLSSSLPLDVQYAFIRTIPALKKAEIMRPAYAIEYDYILCGQMDVSLESKQVEGLFFSGQINGTTGYEEAAGQGIIAGINAASKAAGKTALHLKRSESYIGVMLDDLTTKMHTEPYRMFTSRAEHRLLLRQDNADLRLRGYGYEYGLISSEQYQRLKYKEKSMAEAEELLARSFTQVGSRGYSLQQILTRPETTYRSLVEEYPNKVVDYGDDINFQIELDAKYAGYIARQKQEVKRFDQMETVYIPASFDFTTVVGLRNEAKEKLLFHSPKTVGQASRISGVNPADVTVLMIALSRKAG